MESITISRSNRFTTSLLCKRGRAESLSASLTSRSPAQPEEVPARPPGTDSRPTLVEAIPWRLCRLVKIGQEQSRLRSNPAPPLADSQLLAARLSRRVPLADATLPRKSPHLGIGVDDLRTGRHVASPVFSQRLVQVPQNAHHRPDRYLRGCWCVGKEGSGWLALASTAMELCRRRTSRARL